MANEFRTLPKVPLYLSNEVVAVCGDDYPPAIRSNFDNLAVTRPGAQAPFFETDNPAARKEPCSVAAVVVDDELVASHRIISKILPPVPEQVETVPLRGLPSRCLPVAEK